MSAEGRVEEANRVEIFDTTLRDGEQSPGISLNTQEKVEIATQLARLGVDVIEAGFPITSPGDFEAVEAIARTVEGPVVCGLARTHVADIEAARAGLIARGVDVDEVFHRFIGEAPGSGPDPARRSYASYATFRDPDGNSWLLQEVTARLPGRVDANGTAFTSSTELASALRRAAAAHGEHEKRIGKHDTAGWPEWYAEYIVREQSGEELPQ